MGRWTLGVAAIGLTATVAFLLGRASGGEPVSPAAPSRVTVLTAEVVRLETELGEARRRPVVVERATVRSSAPAKPRSVTMRPATEPRTEPDSPTARLMELVASHLDRGEKGYEELLLTLAAEDREEDLELLIDDLTDSGPEAYRWLMFLIEREEQSAALTEWLFRSISEKPARFHAMDDEFFDVLLGDLASFVVATASRERVESLGELLQTVLATPSDLLPDPVRKNRAKIKRLSREIEANRRAGR